HLDMYAAVYVNGAMRVPSCGYRPVAWKSAIVTPFNCLDYDPVASRPTTGTSSAAAAKKRRRWTLQSHRVSSECSSAQPVFPQSETDSSPVRTTLNVDPPPGVLCT